MRLRAEVRGIVQGVGFRPFVYRIAVERGLQGWVRNRPDGVELEVQGEETAIRGFLQALRDEAPRASRIEGVESSEIQPEEGAEGFAILTSGSSESRRPVVPPDLALCADCAAEMDAPGQRRFRYPFTNCTYCGPRYSIIEGLPYDRPRTSMKAFPFCPDCEREFRNPLDRRFHAQPVACPVCGPHLTLRKPDGSAVATHDEAVLEAARSLLRGEVLALKGLGGYQLLVDATSAAAVQRLRDRKRREDKPFAVMFPGLDSLEAACEVSAEESELLTSAEAPIVLLKRRALAAGIQDSVAPRNPWIGAFLPYTPLHRLLLKATGQPLVCTSGNLSDEPMAFQDDEALARLGDLADLFLTHDRPVVRPVDDSVVRVDGDGPTLLRRARGFAPRAQALPQAAGAPSVLAFGAHQKNTVALLFEGQVVMSQHLGDLSSREGAALLETTVRDLLDFFHVEPARLACDLHPDYASTRLAERMARQSSLPLTRVQHHHAHGAACAAEHGLRGPALALAWDGTGLGSDGTLWGGEALLLEGASFRRLGHLKPFALPGGDKAAKEPRRSAAGLLWSAMGPASLAMVEPWFTPQEARLLQSMLERNLNCPRSSSMGRLFDAVSALCGLRWQRGFEGQAAMELEFASTEAPPEDALPWAFEGEEALVADPAPLLAELLRRKDRGASPSRLGRAFHAALADLALAWARQANVEDVLLSGGCFQNALLALEVRLRLEAAGFRVLRHRAFPPNDGCIALGQAAVAAGLAGF
jgi:hydrogenase maturation protein HypF